MGVYIKGMEMPKGCPCELIGIGYDLSCSFAGGVPARVKEYYECCQNGTRPFWCPLVPVPEHGRLIVNAPAADVASVRHGEWFVSIGKDGKPVGTICPICGFAWSEAIDSVKLEPCLSLIKTPYCPNCGALMDKDGDGT